MTDTFVAIDFETADDGRDSACAVGLARVEGAAIVYRDAVLIRPPRSMSARNTAVHGLTWAMVKDAPLFAEAWAKLLPVLDGATRLVAHNAVFDRSVLVACCKAAGLPTPALPWTCTLELARRRWPKPRSNRLPDVCGRLGITQGRHHKAGADAEACARVLIALEDPDGRLPRRPRAEPEQLHHVESPLLGRLALPGLDSGLVERAVPPACDADALAGVAPVVSALVPGPSMASQEQVVGVTLSAHVARLVAACPWATDLAIDLHQFAAERGEAEATELARIVADCAASHAARCRLSPTGWATCDTPGSPVSGERLPGHDDRRVVWVGRKALRDGVRPLMGLIEAGQARGRKKVEPGLPAEATHWACVGGDCWIRVPGGIA